MTICKSILDGFILAKSLFLTKTIYYFIVDTYDYNNRILYVLPVLYKQRYHTHKDWKKKNTNTAKFQFKVDRFFKVLK